jgi:shikimate kinase
VLKKMKRVFIIGPGGVGKTTCGKIFAEKISFDFIDIDLEFMHRIGNIDSHIEEQGYLSYRRNNSNLFYELMKEQNNDTVFALSSGFLVHDSDLTKHLNSIRNSGLSILLLPSESLEETEKIIVARQLSRGLNCKEDRERQKIRARFYRYLQLGDIKVFSSDSPQTIAEIMNQKYRRACRTQK